MNLDMISLNNQWSLNILIEKENDFMKNFYCSGVVEKYEVL